MKKAYTEQGSQPVLKKVSQLCRAWIWTGYNNWN